MANRDVDREAAVLVDEYDDEAHRDMFMLFDLAGQAYGLEVLKVVEIVGMQAVTEVPDVPDYVKGVMNLRGNVIPVVDVRLRFRMEPRDYNDRTCVVVIRDGGLQVGIVVDAVREVMVIREKQISDPPVVSEEQGQSAFIRGMGRLEDEVVIILDTGKLLCIEHAAT